MRDRDRTLLTLEQRLELAARSQASSPEAAAGLVRRFSEIHAGLVFCGNADLNLMNELTGEFWDHPAVEVDSYHGFCHSFRLALEADFAGPEDPEALPDPYQPAFGVRVNNAIVLLGLMLLDHAKDRLKRRDVYHCTRMTLGQYLDALETLAFSEGNAPPGLHFRTWKDIFLRRHDRAAPLGEALADILRRYIAGWQVFDRLDHILRCVDGLSRCLEQGAAEEGERVPDPCGHYLALARQYPADPPDPGGKDTALGSIRSQIFLSERDCSPRSLRAPAAQPPSPELGALLEKNSGGKRLATAMREINMAVIDLYMLWVEPYLRMEG